MKRIWILACWVVILATFCRSGAYAYDTITLPWSTSFSDCANGEYAGCSNFAGISSGGPHCGFTCNISADANHSGSPARGLRQWFDAGQNQNTYGLAVAFATKVDAFYVRWYERYKAGFVWNYLQYKKDLYIHDDLVSGTQSLIPEPQGGKYCVVPVTSGGPQTAICSADGVMSSITSDGNWHSYELYYHKNGTCKFWLDGVQIINTTGPSFPNQWGSIDFASNINSVGGACQYIDYDDFAVSATGYIGPIGGGGDGDNTPPASPKRLRVN